MEEWGCPTQRDRARRWQIQGSFSELLVALLQVCIIDHLKERKPVCLMFFFFFFFSKQRCSTSPKESPFSLIQFSNKADKGMICHKVSQIPQFPPLFIFLFLLRYHSSQSALFCPLISNFSNSKPLLGWGAHICIRTVEWLHFNKELRMAYVIRINI